MTYFSTHILDILFRKKRLKNSLKIIIPRDTLAVESFLTNIYQRKHTEPDESIKHYIPELLKYGLISETDQQKQSKGCSLLFTDVINFELTYNCDKKCPHCLQSNIAKNATEQLSTEQIINSIFQAYISGICSVGINFTGGEILGNRVLSKILCKR